MKRNALILHSVHIRRFIARFISVKKNMFTIKISSDSDYFIEYLYLFLIECSRAMYKRKKKS